tara:strand:+ start:305 stop:547 length:243 start_codon:yes stop_codon:yes gene_type:complete
LCYFLDFVKKNRIPKITSPIAYKNKSINRPMPLPTASTSLLVEENKPDTTQRNIRALNPIKDHLTIFAIILNIWYSFLIF